MKTLKGHTNTVNSLSFTPSGSHLASSSNDLSIKLWDFATYACVRTLRGHDHTISSVRFIPAQGIIPTNEDNANFDVTAAGAQHLLSASRDQTVKLWDMATGFCDHTFADHSDWVRCLSIRQSDGAIWASSGNDQVIYVYNHNERKKVAELRGHEHVVESIAFLSEEAFPKSTNNRDKTQMDTIRDYLASGGRDRTVRLWSISNASCLAVFTSHENWVKGVLIHPSGNYLVSGGDDRTIRVFDIKANRCLRTLENAHNHFITALDMHHTLPVMVSGGVDQTLKTWVLD
jgi:platelet-activating factor acetylhydrolase IB subunit alpha